MQKGPPAQGTGPGSQKIDRAGPRSRLGPAGLLAALSRCNRPHQPRNAIWELQNSRVWVRALRSQTEIPRIQAGATRPRLGAPYRDVAHHTAARGPQGAARGRERPGAPRKMDEQGAVWSTMSRDELFILMRAEG